MLMPPPLCRLTLMFLFIFPCVANAFDSAPYFPLAIMGNYWNYSGWIHTGPLSSLPSIGLGPNSGKRGTRTVVVKSGQIYDTVSTTLFDSKASWEPYSTQTYLTNDSRGITLYSLVREPSDGVTCAPFTPPLTYLPALVELGLTYRANASMPCSAGSLPLSISWDMTMTLVGFEKVTVPAGTFNALRIEQTVVYSYSNDPSLTQTDHNTIWLAYGIGEVKMLGQVTNDALSQTIDYYAEELSSTLFLHENPQKDDGCSECSIGDPINYATGNQYQSQLDYMGVGEFPLRIERTYNRAGPSNSDSPISDSLAP